MHSESLLGKGNFYFGTQTIEREFKIVFYPLQTIIEISAIPLDGYYEDSWSLKGILADGIKVESDNLICLGVGDNELFVNELFLGDKIDISNTSSFPLLGYYGKILPFNYKGYTISIMNDKNFKIEKRFYDRTGIIREGASLILSREQHNIMVSFGLVELITLLLSLATGNQVTFNKRIYDNKYIVCKRPIYTSSGFDNIIDYMDMGRYLEATLQVWNSLDITDQELITKLTTYLNLAGRFGYLDERMFKVAQGWEMAASKWGNYIETPSEAVHNLKARLKETYKLWRSDFPEMDKDGLFNTRILNSLEWESYIKIIEHLVNEFKLDSTKLNLDFKLLKNKVRDKVAHEGRMIPFQNAHVLFEDMKFGLRLIILKKLKYEGPINFHEDNWGKRFDINYYFK